MAISSVKHSLFLGTFIHSKSLDTLDYLHNTAVFVSENGKIVHVEPDCDQKRAEETLIPQLGWVVEQVDITIAKDGQFFFPGFIGMFPLPHLSCFKLEIIWIW